MVAVLLARLGAYAFTHCVASAVVAVLVVAVAVEEERRKEQGGK
jgi:hypothetical protein